MSKKKRKRNNAIVIAVGVVLLLSVILLVIIKGKEYQERKQYEALQESVTGETEKVSETAQDVTAVSNSDSIDSGEMASLDDDSTAADSTEGLEQEDTNWYAAYAKEPDRSIDFGELTAVNPDVYAWITIPGTKIDYPVAHCDAETAFYLDHDIDGNKSSSGMIFTDTYNTNDFSDPMTLVYGHNMKNGTMFAGLHAFRDSKFFQEHDTVKIYMDGIELDYRIYDCFAAPNEHILDQNDFHDALVFTRYFEDLSQMRDLSANFREGMEVNFTDHVITLVTCIGQSDKRLFIQAVLQEPDDNE